MTPYLHVADFGAIGDGQTDDTAALQSAISAACPLWPASCKKLISPADSVFKISSTLVIQQCGYAQVDLQNAQIVWAGPPGGTCLLLNQVMNSDIRNVRLTMTGANVGIDIDSQPPFWLATTGNHLENITIMNHSVNPQFVGIRMGVQAQGNCDRHTFKRITIYASDTPPTSSSSNGYGFLIPFNSQAQPFWTELNNINTTYCSHGIHASHIGLFRVVGGLANHNYTDFCTESGRGIYYGWIRSEGAIAPIVLGNDGSNPDDVELDHLELNGLTPGTTTILSARGASSMMLHMHDLTWDQTVNVTPIGGGSNGTLFTRNNLWPIQGSPRPSWSKWGGWVHEGTPTGSNTMNNGGLYASKLSSGEPA